MNDNYQTPITYQSVARAVSFIRKPSDGSVANAQARQVAAAHLFATAEKFERFAEMMPESDVAVYLNTKAQELRTTACLA